MFKRVNDQYRKDAAEHKLMMKNDPYYAHCHGGGKVPSPCCQYCTEYDGDRCHIRWNNNDECYYNPDLDDKEPDDLCEHYEWNGEWEDE